MNATVNAIQAMNLLNRFKSTSGMQTWMTFFKGLLSEPGADLGPGLILFYFTFYFYRSYFQRVRGLKNEKTSWKLKKYLGCWSRLLV